jgi:hypothetical protein
MLFICYLDKPIRLGNYKTTTKNLKNLDGTTVTFGEKKTEKWSKKSSSSGLFGFGQIGIFMFYLIKKLFVFIFSMMPYKNCRQTVALLICDTNLPDLWSFFCFLVVNYFTKINKYDNKFSVIVEKHWLFHELFLLCLYFYFHSYFR